MCTVYTKDKSYVGVSNVYTCSLCAYTYIYIYMSVFKATLSRMSEFLHPPTPCLIILHHTFSYIEWLGLGWHFSGWKAETFIFTDKQFGSTFLGLQETCSNTILILFYYEAPATFGILLLNLHVMNQMAPQVDCNIC